MDDTISRQAAIDAICEDGTQLERQGQYSITMAERKQRDADILDALPSAQPEIIRCKDCKHWRQQTNYQGALLSFGFCESDDMWRSLYGETYEVSHIDTDDDFYCGYAERKEE